MAQTLIPGGVLSLSAEAADRLLKMDSGDGALLYLHLLRHGSVDGLKWDATRLQSAMDTLARLEMAPQLRQPVPQPPALPVDEPAPTYSMEEITQAVEEGGSQFPMVADEVERQLGKKLSAADLKSLYTLYDHLALPPEVILLLTTHCVEEHQRKFGAGRRPFVSAIRKEGFRWSRLGIETMERGEEFLRQQTVLRSRESGILQIFDLQPRPLVSREQGYVAEWQAMALPDEVIRLAYEKTVMKKGSLDWSYVNGILRRWHEKGLHTLEAIQKGDKSQSGAGQLGFRPNQQSPQQSEEKVRSDIQRMRRIAEEMRREEG